MLKTGLLLAALTAFFMAMGHMIGGSSGMMMALLFAIGTNFFAYWFSDKMVLKMYGAQPLNDPNLNAMIARLAANAGIPTPKSYLMENPQPNAFATGRSPAHGAVALTTGLLSMLNEDEIEGVIAHELAHIKNRDTLIMTVTATIAGAIGMLANFAMFFGGRNGENRNPIVGILVMILAPMAAMLVQMAISRTREYSADATGAAISGKPEALASALAKISRGAAQLPNYAAESNPATAHLFIMNPLHLHKVDNFFSTHPNPQNRIDALMEMAKNAPTQNAPIRKGSFGF
jgi:heat shock protein HtpX